MSKKHIFTLKQSSESLADVFIASGNDNFFDNNSAYFSTPKDYGITVELVSIEKEEQEKARQPFEPILIKVTTKINGSKNSIAKWIEDSETKAKAASFVLGGI